MKMADRFFPNEMPNFIPETPSLESPAVASSDSLSKLLHMPYKTLSEELKKKALDLKDTVVKETWIAKRKRVSDGTLYTGALGTAFLLFKAYQVTRDKNDLTLCSEIIKACDSASRGSSRVTFICGQAGVFALGAVAAKHNGDEQLCQHYLAQFKQIELAKDLPNEILYGRAGFLWACSFLNKHIGEETISTSSMVNHFFYVVMSNFLIEIKMAILHCFKVSQRAIADEIIKSGRQLAKGRCPLMYEWHGKKYWGAAHGLAGIMHVLMDVDLKPDEVEHVKGTLRHMIKNRFLSGNYPSSEGSETDRLVHWCHGAPGVALTFVKAAKVFGSEKFLHTAMNAGEVVWNRGLLKRVGICHGISGNAYVFLSLYQLTGNPEFLYRAKAFACLLYDRAQTLISEGVMHGGDRPYSLFEGFGGMAYLFLDMIEPSEARFPAYEL